MLKYCLLSILFAGLSCVSVSGDGQVHTKGRHNHLVSVIKPVMPERFRGAYNHTLYYDDRAGGDCQPNCPQIDIWQYEYLGKVSSKPISTQKAFWKSPKEARIIAYSLFGKNPIYYQGLLGFLKSFQTLKRLNNIQDKIWGFDTFVPRVYIPKRNPNGPMKDTPLEGELEPYQIQTLLEAGCELVYVDNGLKKASKDATFWRFMVAAEPMPEGQKIRYIVHDADWIMTGAEAFAVGEWMALGHQYHRSHLQPICLGPLTASWWAGSHTGKGSFADLKEAISFFPYRMKYGDDELFLRDIMWPRMKQSGSILTHVTKRTWVSNVVSPYQGSCEEPTKSYCNSMNLDNQCEDLELPENMEYPYKELSFRKGLAKLEKKPKFFDMKLQTERGRRVYEALKL
ncbi:MAG: hypothetical protein JKY15_05570 [Deltaproteobacteria bacterium]|nr:hypothetical protein [Deltaproteobacteria bacterium]